MSADGRRGAGELCSCVSASFRCHHRADVPFFPDFVHSRTIAARVQAVILLLTNMIFPPLN